MIVQPTFQQIALICYSLFLTSDFVRVARFPFPTWDHSWLLSPYLLHAPTVVHYRWTSVSINLPGTRGHGRSDTRSVCCRIVGTHVGCRLGNCARWSRQRAGGGHLQGLRGATAAQRHRGAFARPHRAVQEAPLYLREPLPEGPGRELGPGAREHAAPPQHSPPRAWESKGKGQPGIEPSTSRLQQIQRGAKGLRGRAEAFHAHSGKFWLNCVWWCW